MKTEIAIAGGSITGLHAATKLKNQGYDVSIFDRTDILPISTPIFSAATAGMLGITSVLDQSYGATQAEIKYGTAGQYLNRSYSTPRFTAKMEDLVGLMKQKALNAGVILYDGRATDAIIEKERVTGFLTDQDEVYGEIVLDATGKNAVVTSSAREQMPTLIKEHRLRQPSTLVGIYAHLDLPEKEFPRNKIHLGTLDKGVLLILNRIIPLRPDEKSTHLLLLEGDQTIIRNTQTRINNVNSPLTERRLLLLKELMKGTPWFDHFSNVKAEDIQDTIYYAYNEGITREVRVDGLAPIGDAQGHENPLMGRGIKHAAYTVHDLLTEINTAPTLLDGVRRHNQKQQETYRRMRAESAQLWNFFQSIHPVPQETLLAK